MQSKTQTIIAFLIVLGFLGVVGAWFVFPVKGDAGLFNLLLGMLGSGFGTIIQYFFGSSSGSKAKDETISNIASSTVPATPTNITPLARATP
jgi:uncharacterized membrane protein YeaQ/YmgE (transglycosylase-associated protein family)